MIDGRKNFSGCNLTQMMIMQLFAHYAIQEYISVTVGRRAITSHQKRKKHQMKEKRACISTPLTHFAVKENTDEVPEKMTGIGNVLASSNLHQVECTTPSVSDELECDKKTIPTGIKKFLFKEEVMKAEILWCLQIIITHRSLRSAEKDVKMFSHIFSDSDIAKGMHLGRGKMMYSIVFGIAPFFKNELMKDVCMCDYFVIGFDESLNKISQKQQMDLNIRYWCTKESMVKTRYLNSVFLERSSAKDLLEAFKNATTPLDLKKTLQVSMDGPNVNFKFLSELTASIKEVPEDHEILNLGSCGLHSVNLAFKTGAKSVDWKIFDFMRALYYVFKDSLARRALYTLHTNSHEIPQKFCSIRWLENAQVAERCLSILSNVKVFIAKADKEKNPPNSHSYILVKSLINDVLLPAKLAFFHSVATEFETFLREYQTDVPLIPFLYEDLKNLMLRIMKKFIKKDLLTKRNPLKVEVDKVCNHLPCNEIDVGISALCHLRKIKVSEGHLNIFYKDCRKFLICYTKKLQERSPLIYEITRSVSCFNPQVTVNQKLFEKRLTKLLVTLCEKNWLGTVQADKAKNQFQEICCSSSNLSKLKSYSKADRIDQFWYEMLSSATKPCDDALLVVKMMMLLSHGNSNVERGFSINKDCLWENMKEETTVARRIIYDALQVHGNLNEFEITKQMVLSVKNSRARYEEEKQKRKQEEKEIKQNLKRKKETETQLKELEEKKKILDDAQKEALIIEEEITFKLFHKKL